MKRRHEKETHSTTAGIRCYLHGIHLATADCMHSENFFHKSHGVKLCLRNSASKPSIPSSSKLTSKPLSSLTISSRKSSNVSNSALSASTSGVSISLQHFARRRLICP